MKPCRQITDRFVPPRSGASLIYLVNLIILEVCASLPRRCVPAPLSAVLVGVAAKGRVDRLLRPLANNFSSPRGTRDLPLGQSAFVSAKCGVSIRSKSLTAASLFFPCLSLRLFESHPGSATALIDELDPSGV